MKEHPTLRLVMEMLCNDSGLDVDAVSLDEILIEDPARVEAALAGLSQEELETIVIGDQDEWEEIYLKLGKDREVVHRALETMFNGIGG